MIKIPKSFILKSSYKNIVLKLSELYSFLKLQVISYPYVFLPNAVLVMINNHQCGVSSEIGEENWRRWWDGESGRIKRRVGVGFCLFICCSICQQWRDGIDRVKLPPYLYSQASTARETQLYSSLFKDSPREGWRVGHGKELNMVAIDTWHPTVGGWTGFYPAMHREKYPRNVWCLPRLVHLSWVISLSSTGEIKMDLVRRPLKRGRNSTPLFLFLTLLNKSFLLWALKINEAEFFLANNM